MSDIPDHVPRVWSACANYERKPVIPFAVSTTAFRGQDISSIVSIAKQHDLLLEFSSGLSFDPEMQRIYREAGCRRIPHNYFPAPQVPFVLNLASLRADVWTRSVDHCKQGLKLAALAGAPFFSAHAGFCIDPRSEDLGQQFPSSELQPREAHWERFTQAVKELVDVARSYGIKFLVENNVLARMNVARGTHPLLCVSHEEMVTLMKEVDRPSLGVLLDTGHLKVSANTLAFSRTDFVESVRSFVCGIHHSDNNGEEDSNEPVTPSYWFLPYMPAFHDALHILEVHDQDLNQIDEQYRLLDEASAIRS